MSGVGSVTAMRSPLRTLRFSLIAWGIAVPAAPAVAAPPTKTAVPTVEPAAEATALSREAQDLLRHGHIDAVLARYAQTLADRAPGAALDRHPWPAAEAVPLGRALAAVGRHDEARQVLQAHATTAKPLVAAVLALAEVERQTGSLPVRRKLLFDALKRVPGQPQIMVALGETLLEQGQSLPARKLLDPLADRYEAETLREPLDLVAVARSLALNGYARDANNVFERAEAAAAEPEETIEIELRWGQLLLAKYNYRDADKAFAKVLALQPGHPEAVIGMARVDLDSDHDIGGARRRLDALLARNPRHLDALVLRTEIALHDEDWPGAKAFSQRALQQRPDAVAALHVEAARCRLVDDDPCFAVAEKAARKVNPDDGRLYHVTATWLEQAHRYREVLDLLRTAIERDPSLWQAHAALGLAYARIADDTKAHKHLETAHGGDPFDVRTANQLSVLYDGVLQQMVLLPGRVVDLRVHRKDRKAMERAILPFLQESHDLLAKKYGFVAARPLQVEIFPETEHFSVRTVGLPRLGAHAVCFGHLITSRSPQEAPFNWKMVLHHELSHVFHIQASDGRVPRWLTEGLAMMESAWADPRHRMRADRRAYDRYKQGQLATIERFNLAFSQARSMQDILDAYNQAMLLVEFLNERFGFARLAALVAGHKSGKATADLVQVHLGVAPAVVDKEFAVWLAKQLKRYDKDFRPSVQAVAAELGLKPPEGAALPVVPDADASDGEVAGETPTEEAAIEVGRQAAKEAAEAADLAAKEEARRSAAGEPATAPVDKGSRAALANVVAALQQGRGHTAVKAMKLALAAPAPANPTPQGRLDLCAIRYWLMELSFQVGDKTEARTQAAALTQQAGGVCDGVRARVTLALLARAEGKAAETVQHLTAAQALDPTDGTVVQLFHEIAVRAAQQQDGDATARGWLDALTPGGDTAALRAIVRNVIQNEANSPEPGALLGRLAWRQWQTPASGSVGATAPAAATTPTAGAKDADTARAALSADLLLAAQTIEASHPGNRLGPLFEARHAVAEGKPLAALPPYRLATERSENTAERAEAWCELRDAATSGGARDDAAEAQRRCVIERPAPKPEVPAPATAPARKDLKAIPK